MKKVLIVVDVQKDFCPGGSLAVPNGDEVVPFINSISKNYDVVIFTKDDHPPKMEAFASSHNGKKPFDSYINSQGEEDILWADHCVIGTIGNEFHDDLNFKDLKEYYIFRKGIYSYYHPYSGFESRHKFKHGIDIGGTPLDSYLKSIGVDEIDVVGLATDFCVKDTVLDGVKLGYKVNLLLDGCRGISDDLTDLYKEFEDNGVNIVQNNEVVIRHFDNDKVYIVPNIVVNKDPDVRVDEDGEYNQISIIRNNTKSINFMPNSYNILTPSEYSKYVQKIDGYTGRFVSVIVIPNITGDISLSFRNYSDNLDLDIKDIDFKNKSIIYELVDKYKDSFEGGELFINLPDDTDFSEIKIGLINI